MLVKKGKLSEGETKKRVGGGKEGEGEGKSGGWKGIGSAVVFGGACNMVITVTNQVPNRWLTTKSFNS